MAVETVTVKRYVCDACDRFFADYNDADLPGGYHLEVTHVSNLGIVEASVYACSEPCLRKAIARALDDAVENV